MKIYATSSNSRPGHLWQAVLTVLILSVTGIISFTSFGFHISLQWLPLMAVALWPRTATPILSVIALLLLGLFQDWLGYGVPGQWAFLYLLLFLIIRPFERIKPLHFGQGMSLWLTSVVVGFLVLTLTGRLIYGVWPDWFRLIVPAVTATIIFPIFWLLRQNLQAWLLRREEAS
jgi:hypothetical protein